MSLSEFVEYGTKHEQKLKEFFTKIDVNRDGRIDLNEIVAVSNNEFGIQVDIDSVRGFLANS